MKFFRRRELSPGDEHAKRGLLAADADDYHTAVFEIERAIQLGASHYDIAELYTVLGKAYERINDFDKSVIACQKALDLRPDYHPAWNNLGIAYYYLGKIDESEQCHLRAISIRPDYASAHASLGAVYIGRNEPQKAVEALQRAITLSPRFGVAHGNLALAYAMLGQYEEATASLEKSIAFGYKGWREVADRMEALKVWREMRDEIEQQTSHVQPTGWEGTQRLQGDEDAPGLEHDTGLFSRN